MKRETSELIVEGESATIEFKRSLSDEQRILETVAAMATIGGGTVLVGVRDDGEVVGVELAGGARERFVQRAMAAIDPRVYLDVREESVEERTVLRIDVPPGDGPHLAKGRAFLRSGPATIAMSRDEYERRLLARLRESHGYERVVDEGSSLDDIDPEVVRAFVQRGKARGARSAADPGEVVRRLRMTSGEHLTVAGQLLFGREAQAAFPQAVVRARARRGGVEDARAIEGSLFSQIDDAVAFVLRNLRVKPVREGVVREDRLELPEAAVREVIANAVAHRDYRSTAPTQLVLDDRALVVWNPGQLPPPLTAARLREEHPSVPPNPLIARALYVAGYIEEWGTGTNRIVATMRAQGNGEPLFEERDAGLRVTLPLPGALPEDLSPRQALFLRDRASGESFTTVDYAGMTGVAKRTALADLRQLADLGLVAAEGRGKASRWRRL